MWIGDPIASICSGVQRAAARRDEAGVSAAVERGAKGGKLPEPQSGGELPEWWRIEGGTVDLLSARINLTESGMFEEVGTWIEIYDTDLVEVSESEDD